MHYQDRTACTHKTSRDRMRLVYMGKDKREVETRSRGCEAVPLRLQPSASSRTPGHAPLLALSAASCIYLQTYYTCFSSLPSSDSPTLPCLCLSMLCFLQKLINTNVQPATKVGIRLRANEHTKSQPIDGTEAEAAYNIRLQKEYTEGRDAELRSTRLPAAGKHDQLRGAASSPASPTLWRRYASIAHMLETNRWTDKY
jgi:hypothetical protein